MAEQVFPLESPSRPRVEIRRTQLQAMLSCAAAETGEGGANAAFGSAVHQLIASYWAACLALGQEEHRSGLEQLAHQAFHSAAGVDVNRWPEFLQLCLDFADVHLLGARTLIAYEKPLAVDAGWAILNGRLDRLDRSDDGDPDDDPTRITVTDYKTQWAPEEFDFQGRTYAQLVFLNYPSVEEVEWQLDFIRRRGLPEPVVYERGELDGWWAGVIEQAERIYQEREAGRAVPTGGSACTFCAKRYSCGAALTSAATIPENDDQAAETISTWLRLQAAEEEHKRALKAYFGDRAPVLFNGLEVGFLSSREPQPAAEDPAAVAAWMDARGMEGEVALKTGVDWTKVPRLYWPELVESGLATLPDRREFKARRAESSRRQRASGVEPSAGKPGAAGLTDEGSKGLGSAAAAGAGSAPDKPESLTELARRAVRSRGGAFQ